MREEDSIDVLSTLHEFPELLVQPCYDFATVSTYSCSTHYMLFMNIGEVIDFPRIFKQHADSLLLLEEQIQVSLFPAEDGVDNVQM